MMETESKTYPKEWKEIERLARGVFEQGRGRADVWTHRDGGAETGSTFRRNVEAFDQLGFEARFIHDVTAPELAVDLMGKRVSCSIAIGPMSSVIAKVCDETFVAMAEGCKEAGIIASCGFPVATDTLRKMVQTGAWAFQVIKPLKDRGKLKAEVERVEQEGGIAVGVDVDSIAGLKATGDEPHFHEICTTYSVKELAEVRSRTKLPFIVKGVLSVEDAIAAIDSGADIIVVSTHAGFAMDYTRSSLEVLPAIRKAVGKRATIILDSGVRRGSDVIKALALGADAVFIGRLALWGLAMDGASGLAWVLKLIREEMARTMILMGIKKVGDLHPGCLVPLGPMGERILESC
ncbi:MAG TPA: alpha-hydroxy-acid oxidizing protein [Firmicutes bacterium]|nr:alpha-hydroxy-acid oxidizing protein [Bacillota bacterium]